MRVACCVFSPVPGIGIIADVPQLSDTPEMLHQPLFYSKIHHLSES
jgi:hypothetical protein